MEPPSPSTFKQSLILPPKCLWSLSIVPTLGQTRHLFSTGWPQQLPGFQTYSISILSLCGSEEKSDQAIFRLRILQGCPVPLTFKQSLNLTGLPGFSNIKTHLSSSLLPSSPSPSCSPISNLPNFFFTFNLGHGLFTPSEHSSSPPHPTLLAAFVWWSHSFPGIETGPEEGVSQPATLQLWAQRPLSQRHPLSPPYSVGDSLGCFELR